MGRHQRLAAIARLTLTLTLGLTLAPATVAAADQCVLPQSIPAARSQSFDWRNTEAKTDYYMLALSWSPEHCAESGTEARSRIQCGLNKFRFVVHGLWPQSEGARTKEDHPRNCRRADPLPPALVRNHLCTVPGVELMQGQWQRHGSCAFSSPEAYFAKIEELWKDFRQPDLAALVRRSPRPTAGEVREAVVAANGRLGLRREHVMVDRTREGWLEEIRLCYDRGFRPKPCAVRGAPDRAELRIRL